MNDEAIEVMAKAISGYTERDWHTEAARKTFAALRDAGFELYRPEECTHIEVEDVGAEDDLLDVMVSGAAPAGVYRLVPVSAESPKEGE